MCVFVCFYSCVRTLGFSEQGLLRTILATLKSDGLREFRDVAGVYWPELLAFARREGPEIELPVER